MGNENRRAEDLTPLSPELTKLLEDNFDTHGTGWPRRPITEVEEMRGRLEAAEQQLAAVRTLRKRWMAMGTDPDIDREERERYLELADELRAALAAPPRVAPGDRLTPEQRGYIDRLKTSYEELAANGLAPLSHAEVNLLAILDQHCPRPEPEGTP